MKVITDSKLQRFFKHAQTKPYDKVFVECSATEPPYAHPINTPPVIAGGYLRDMLLRDGEVTDVDLFISVPEETFRHLIKESESEAVCSGRKGLYIVEGVLTDEIAFLFLESNEKHTEGCIYLERTLEADYEASTFLSFKSIDTGDVPLNVIFVLATEEMPTAADYANHFSCSISQMWMPVFPMGEVHMSMQCQYDIDVQEVRYIYYPHHKNKGTLLGYKSRIISKFGKKFYKHHILQSCDRYKPALRSPSTKESSYE